MKYAESSCMLNVYTEYKKSLKVPKVHKEHKIIQFSFLISSYHPIRR